VKKMIGIGAGIGAGVMYLMDPRSGKHRRSIMKHKLAWLGKHIGKGVAWPILRIT
jgi:hypothetical protein